MQTGFGAVADAIKRASTRQTGQGGTPQGLPYFGWIDDDDKGHKTRVIRFLTDEVILCKFYEYVVCNDSKTRDFIFGPSLDKDLHDYVMEYGAKMRPQKNGPLKDPTTREMTVNVAVLRKEVPDPNRPGRTMVIDYMEKRKVREPIFVLDSDGKLQKDKDDNWVVKKDKDGNVEFKEVELDARWFGIVKQGNKNFWNNLLAYHQRYGTICDRDYEITRNGNDQNTFYGIIPIDQDPDLDTTEKVQQFYGYGVESLPNDPDRLLRCPLTLPKWAYNLAGEARAKRWLSEVKEEGQTSASSSESAASTVEESATPSEPASSTASTSDSGPVEAAPQEAMGFSDMKARLLANRQ